MIVDISITYLFSAVSLGIWVIGLFLGKDMTSQVLGIVLCLFASMMWITLWTLTTGVIPSYSVPQVANTTETGGITTCVTSGSGTTCTPTAITKSFSYKNSTGQITNAPDSIPNVYPTFGNPTTGANSSNSYLTIIAIGFGVIMGFIGTFQQRLRS